MTDSEHPLVAKVRARLEQLATPKAKERGLDRSTRVNRINKPRAEKRRAEDFGPCSRAARRGACAVPGCKSPPPQEPAHVRSRGAGGHDWKNVVGLCSKHHREQHDTGVATFAARFGSRSTTWLVRWPRSSRATSARTPGSGPGGAGAGARSVSSPRRRHEEAKRLEEALG